MALPNLLHPINVTIERLTRSEMVMDEDAREAVHGYRSAQTQTFTLPAQVSWGQRDNPVPQEAGVREENSGYILVRLVDMTRVLGAGSRLARGDHIIAIGSMSGLDLYIEGQLVLGHYPDQNGPSMIRYYFSDRHPTRQDGDL